MTAANTCQYVVIMGFTRDYTVAYPCADGYARTKVFRSGKQAREFAARVGRCMGREVRYVDMLKKYGGSFI